jgi:hypothetical protein
MRFHDLSICDNVRIVSLVNVKYTCGRQTDVNNFIRVSGPGTKWFYILVYIL